MGTFVGHALPGSFFISFAIWWTIQMFNRYFISLRCNNRFVSTPTYPYTCCCGKSRKWPIEPIVKITFVGIGMAVEIIAGMHGEKFGASNGQHATMFFFFGLSGCMDLLVQFRAPLPKDLDYVVLLLATGIEGLLFHFHLHGRNKLDVLVHTLLMYVIVLNLVAICLEMKYRNNLLAALSRAYCFFLQGTWFWQVGFILYNPNPNAVKWKGDDHDELMIATMFFAWHCGIVFLIVLAIGGLVAYINKYFNGFKEEKVAMQPLIPTDSNGQTIISMNDDSDSDLEFQKPVTK